MKIEYKVRPVTRYVVTRYEELDNGGGAGCIGKGEFDNAEIAYQVAYALAKEEHQSFGFPPGDERIIYPDQPLFNLKGECIGTGRGIP